MTHRLELRCFCAHRPLLAVYGKDDQGRVYVHIRVYKQSRVYHESIVYGGEVRILCRECYRWHRVVFVPQDDTAKLQETKPPRELAVS